ncbi:glutamine synthetase family protein [Salinisphaera sp. Q1T1-3]|uniref:glutamine synthetase family protein n=1 Tax=Salinisphaera sp. Q1T1-3 TaxID=2321229 RepID=UPI000E73CF34|nr:glutamine synthetase family protein [Salinisphaera sp. Q1T1-3]RJS93300.1 glutamine synthetase [Salinisphaera sp. Q1T1-3]
MIEDTSDPRVRDWFETHEISEVECLVPDITGEAKGKIMPAARYLNGERPRLPDSIFIQTATGAYPDNEDEIVDPAELDMQLTADLSTCRLVPWAREPTAQVIHECRYLNGEAVEVSPRHVLRRVLALYEEMGLRPVVAPEMEFYLVQRNTDADYPLKPPAGRSGRLEISRRAYSIDAVNEFEDVFEDMYAYCEAEELDIDTLIHEEGSGQMEINFEHGDPLELADQAFLFKRTLREVALAHGMYGTFMAKPMADEPGSSMHLHQSLLDTATGENVFADESGQATSLFHHFIAGLQTYLPSALALFAPNVNSYRRLMPDSSNASAPINTEWGYDNRTVGLRVPHSGRSGRRVENRIAGADVNPYLAIAASLACGYLGLVDQRDPRSPVADSAYAQGHRLPSDLGRALEALAGCDPLKALLGRRFIETYLAVKRTEERAHFKVISSWEREYLLLRV